ncbi:M14 family zinc carboxypeptidase [Pleionea mediterranea]|uniref:PKD repeat protein n=1 Tax=Pleionea mediterranea TaxID=523701 RepID=A0A316G023_9GAMM|nr:M14 family zinc carboxypeptidase [Pleionea mediterranea]PWK54179.1 PKD repeat protein [Pleionea mediterranea]
MKLFSLVALMCFSYSWAQAKNIRQLISVEQQGWQNLVQVQAKSKEDFFKLSISHHGELLESNKDALTVTLNLTDAQLEKLNNLGFDITVADSWKQQRKAQLNQLLDRKLTKQLTGIPNYPCYPTVEETYADAEQLATDHSTLTEWIDVGDSWSKTRERGGYDLRVLKITNQSVTDEKPVLFVHSAMHAREYTTAALNLAFAKQLLNSYATDADTRWIVDHHEVHLMFQMNPDGRKYAETGVLWRKNVNDLHCQSSPGIDLNRNFSYFWNSTDGVGSSGDACANTYRGPLAASEPETEVVEAYVRSIFSDNRGESDSDAAPLDTPGMHIDLHSYSELVLWPWGHDYDPAPNGPQLQTLGRKLASFNDYYPTQSTGLYPTDGTSDDVSYGELGVAAITFELGTAFFQSCEVYNTQVKPDNLEALKYAAKVVRAPYKLPAGPDLLQLRGNTSSHPQILPGDTLSITATADDTRFNNSNGDEPTQDITAVSLFVNTPPWQMGTTPIPMTASDSSFNSGVEAVSAEVNTTGWALGEYVIYIQAQDSEGNNGPVSALLVTVNSNQSPLADFSVTCDSLDCHFDASNSSDDSSIESYQWQLSDGAQLTGVTANHRFVESGSYQITLIVTDDRGATGEQSMMLEITAPNQNPEAEFSVSCEHLSCTLNASSSTDDTAISSYDWQLSDGASLSGQTVSHSFSNAGSYSVELTVTDDAGANDVRTRSITVKAKSSSGGALVWFSLMFLTLIRYRIKY